MNKERRIQTPHLPSGGWRVSHALILLITLGVIISDHETKTSDLLKPPTPITDFDTLAERYQLIKNPTATATPIPPTAPDQRIRLATAAMLTTPEQSPESNLRQLLESLQKSREFKIEDSIKALKEATPEVQCTIFYEAGRDTKYFKAYDPYTIASDNYGIGQLNINGKLVEFFRYFKNPFNPYEVVAYMNRAFANGQMYHWGPVVLGLC